MISAEEFVDSVARGRDVFVSRTRHHRIIRICGQDGQTHHEVKLPFEEYERFMKAAMEALAKDRSKRFQFKMKMGFYGAMRVKVRSGKLGQAVSRLGISPRHLAMLSHKVN